MPSLFTLPRELRDKICTYAILSPKELPPLPVKYPDFLEGRDQLHRPQLRAWGDTTTIKYRIDDFHASSTPLLLVNQQLYAETSSNLRKSLLSTARSYDLDIVIHEEVWVLPTWLQVPVLTTSVDRVNVTFRISGSYNKETRKQTKGRYRGFRGGDGAGPAMSWHIYGIMERFFDVGPTGERQQNDEHKHVTIKTLDINVEIPDVDPARFSNPISSSMSRRRESDENVEPPVLDPGYFAIFMVGQIGGLLAMGYHTWNYGGMLYEHLDEVVIRKGGKVVESWDIAESLRDLKHNESFDRNVERFEQWKKDCIETRRTSGLRVLEA